MHVAGDDCAGVLSQGGPERISAEPGTKVRILYTYLSIQQCIMCTAIQYTDMHNALITRMHCYVLVLIS